MCSNFQLQDPLSYDDIVMTLGMIVNGANMPNAEKLNPMEELSYYFSEPVLKMLHLVIQVPPPGEYQPFTHPTNGTNVCISLLNVVAGHSARWGPTFSRSALQKAEVGI